MVKRLIVITLFLAWGMTESATGQINLNFSAGINHSNCTFKQFEGASPEARIGYFIGVAPGYQFSDKIQFQVDVQYSLKGYGTGTETNTTASEFRYGYFDIIPEIEYYLLDFLTLGMGVQYGVKLNEQFKIEGEEWSDAGDYETINSTDFGLTGKLKAYYRNMFGFVRYNLGLKDVSDAAFTDENGEVIEDAKQLNRNLQIGIGYRLDLK